MFRDRVDDAAQPYLWSDAEVIGFLNEAVSEAAIRAQLIRDSTTTAVVQVAIVAATHTYALHASILDVHRAKLALASTPLETVSTEKMDADWPGWELASGTPRYLVLDTSGATFSARLAPIPAANDTLHLIVHRLPIEPMGSDDDAPEIPAREHYRLIDWACRCAYLKQDAETFDQQRADRYEAAFIASFGLRQDANVRRKQANQRPKVVQFREF